MIQVVCAPALSGNTSSTILGSDSALFEAPGFNSDTYGAASLALSNLGLPKPSVRNLEYIACLFHAYHVVKPLDSVKTKISSDHTSDFTTND